MGKAIPAQHPAVVLRSHYKLVRALLAVAMVAVVCLTSVVVILATDDDQGASAGSGAQAAPLPLREHPLRSRVGDNRYDGGPEEGTRGTVFSDGLPNTLPGTRYDGGPEEGSRGSGH